MMASGPVGFDRDDLHDWLVMLSELAVVGLGAWAAWCAFKKAKCEACAASWELARKVATDDDETGTEDQEETG